jgi:hypothetical protein
MPERLRKLSLVIIDVTELHPDLVIFWIFFKMILKDLNGELSIALI